jgi:hypothetical protein
MRAAAHVGDAIERERYGCFFVLAGVLEAHGHSADDRRLRDAIRNAASPPEALVSANAVLVSLQPTLTKLSTELAGVHPILKE